MMPTQKHSFLDFLKVFFESRNVQISEAAREEWWQQLMHVNYSSFDIGYVISAIRAAGQESKYAMVQIGSVMEKLRKSPQIASSNVQASEDLIKNKIKQVKDNLVKELPYSLWNPQDFKTQYLADKVFVGGILSSIEIMMRQNKPDSAKRIYNAAKRALKKIDWEEWPRDAHLKLHEFFKDELKNEQLLHVEHVREDGI